MNVLTVVVLVVVIEMIAWWVRRSMSALHKPLELSMHEVHISDRTLVVGMVRVAGFVALLMYLAHTRA